LNVSKSHNKNTPENPRCDLIILHLLFLHIKCAMTTCSTMILLQIFYSAFFIHFYFLSESPSHSAYLKFLYISTTLFVYRKNKANKPYSQRFLSPPLFLTAIPLFNIWNSFYYSNSNSDFHNLSFYLLHT